MPGEARRRRLRALLKLSGAPNVDPTAIEPAFVHESAAHETGGVSNQRLEFFGDAILGHITAQYLFEHYPLAKEGELAQRKTVLISGESCAASARRLGFGELIVVGVSLQRPGAIENTSVLGDAFEAFIAALYLATDLATAEAFVRREHLALTDRSDLGEPDAKSLLMDLTRARSIAPPTYYERSEGPDHDRRFTSQVRVGHEVLGEGIGSSKKAAQLSAAAMALAALRQRVPPEAPPPPVSKETGADKSSGGRVIAFRARSKRKPDPKPKAPI